jgi:hypothetical protein
LVSKVFAVFALAAAVPQLGECERMIQQVSEAPQRKDMTQRLRAAQTQHDVAAIAEDFDLVITLGGTLESLCEESAQLPLSVQDFETLADRHAQLVLEMVEKCKALTKAKDYVLLDIVANKLDALKALQTEIDDAAVSKVQGTCLSMALVLLPELP